MNKDVRRIFSEAHTAMAKYDASIRSAFSSYKTGKERAQQESARYKDENQEFENRRKALADTAAAAIRAADQEFSDTINERIVPRLREAISEHISQRPNSSFMDALRIYNDYNIRMTKTELQGLMTACGGCYLGLRALSSVAERSGFRLNFDDVNTYERDIVRLEKMARTPVCYAPMDFISEGMEVMPKAPVFRADNSVAYYTDAGTVGMIIQAQSLSSLWHDLESMGSRWASNLVPSVESLEPVKDETTGAEISPEQQNAANVEEANARIGINTDDAEKVAAALGAAQATAARESQNIISHYTR